MNQVVTSITIVVLTFAPTVMNNSFRGWLLSLFGN